MQARKKPCSVLLGLVVKATQEQPLGFCTRKLQKQQRQLVTSQQVDAHGYTFLGGGHWVRVTGNLSFSGTGVRDKLAGGYQGECLA